MFDDPKYRRRRNLGWFCHASSHWKG
jgi:hypothetical protein